ncbi:MAG: NAD(+)/NADH kinase [Desulfovibrio sp.]|jgi:NAD+ kinase|nr:NAD(+)/NADH kinase [Desulfovibrio sp.]
MGVLRRISALALVVKKDNSGAGVLCSEVAEMLGRRGVDFTVYRFPEDEIPCSFPPRIGLILVFGGDGTLIFVARKCLGLNIPIGGVNFGRVGFLNELSAHNCRVVLQKTLDAGLGTREFVSLPFRVFGDGGLEKLRGEAVNDIVITRGNVARLIALDVALNNTPFISFRSDGLIFSTPAGSTGYSGSAGGPLLPPDLHAYLMTAICPYLSNFPPLALGLENVVSVCAAEGNSENLHLTVDGQDAYQLSPGDLLEVGAVKGRFIMADFGVSGYFERLLRCGFVRPAGDPPTCSSGGIHARH